MRTPIDPEILFSDDPLRMLRAARFAARFDMTIDPAIEAAATKMAERLTKVSAERIRGELDLLLLTAAPSVGLDFIVRTGLAEVLLPRAAEAAARTRPDPSAQGRPEAHLGRRRQDLAATWCLRLAALFHDIGKPTTRAISDEGVTFRFHEVVGAKMTRKRMTALQVLPRDDRRRQLRSSNCTCAFTPTSWAGPTRRCVATCATRAHCWMS